MKKTNIILIIILVMLVAAYFILGKKPDKNESKIADTVKPTVMEETIIIGVPPASPQELTDTTIVAQKYDKEFGINVVVKQIPVQNNVMSLLNKDIDVTTQGMTEILISGRNNEISLVYPSNKLYCPILVKSDSKIKDIADLKGKKLALLKKPTSAYDYFDFAMKLMNIDMTKYYQVVESDLLAIPALLLKGDADAINICNTISISKLLSEGKVRSIGSLEAIYAEKFGKDFEIPLAAMAVRRDWLASHQNLMKAYIKARNKALNYLSTDKTWSSKKEFMDQYKLTSEESQIFQKMIDKDKIYVFPDWNKALKSNDQLLKGLNMNITEEQKSKYFVELPLN